MKRIQTLLASTYGTDFFSFFDLAIDFSQYSNIDTLGSDYLRF